MGCVYLLYLEGKVKENGERRWKCINGYFKDIPYGKTEEELSLSHLLINGSRSYFSETYEKLCEIGEMTPFTELSREVREEHPNLIHDYSMWGEEKPDSVANYVTVPVEIFRKHVPDGFSRHGVYHKDRIASFRSGETEELWEEERIDFKKMDPLEKQCYEYFEWDSPYGWELNFKDIDKRIKATERQYATDTWSYEPMDMRLVAFCL